jgi:hypothetical protein
MELLDLPAYSPTLNLIARLWRFIKKPCLYSKYYPDSQSFQQAILTCIQEAPTTHQDALKRLLTLRFQTDLPPRFAQAIMYNSRGALMLERRKRVGVSAYMWRMLLGGGHGVPNASRIAC